MREDGVAPAATLDEVASAAGVSKSTVSRVINGSSSVSPAARERVNRAIADLGFVPNRAAQSLASKRARAIALVIPEDTARFFGDPFFAAVVSGIDAYLRDTDIVLNLLIASGSDHEKTAAYLTGGNADGALVLSHHTSDDFLEILERKLPVVYGGRPPIDAESRYFVDVDNVTGAGDAVSYLAGIGRTRIGTITGPLDMPSGQDRLRGFSEAIAAAGLEEGPVEEGQFTAPSGAEAMRRILEKGHDFDALFVASDLMARGAIDVLRSRGIRVPEDVAVVGFDDSPVAVEAHPELTTIRQPSKEQGSLIAEMLLARLNSKMPDRAVILPTTLVIRESA